MRALRLLLADDETLVRQGIRRLLELDPRMEIAAETADGEEALREIENHRPDVVLLDVRMPRLDGLGVLRALRERPEAPPCLVLTTFDDRTLILEAIREGAKGFLRKDVSLAQLVEAIETLAGGGTYLQPAISDSLMRGLDSARDLPRQPEPALVEALTPRETEVLRLMAAAYTNREIAIALGMAEGTVKIHVSNILSKMGARDRTHAVLRALEMRML
ncbi:MAG TPA: response regulator transcription factor [Thermoanaerobaculia bacterium]